MRRSVARCATGTGEWFAASLALCLTGADGARVFGGRRGGRVAARLRGGRWSVSEELPGRGVVDVELQLLDLVGDCA